MSSAFLNPIFVLLKVLLVNFPRNNLEKKRSKNFIFSLPWFSLLWKMFRLTALVKRTSCQLKPRGPNTVNRLVCWCKHPLSDTSWRELFAAATSKFVKSFLGRQNVNQVCVFLFLFVLLCFFKKIIKALFYPLQLLSFSYARKKNLYLQNQNESLI